MATYSTSTETLVNTYYLGNQNHNYHPKAIAPMADGGYVVVWTSANNQDGSNTGIYMQRFDAYGVKVGIEQRVNTTTADAQNYPQIATLSDGSYVVSWTSNLQDGSGHGVYFQRYTAAGVKVGPETLATTTTVSDQDASSVSALSGGGFIITWDSLNQDGSQYGVYGQRFTNTGVKVGPETRINTTTADYQDSTASTSLANGGYVVVWNSNNQDGGFYGVYMQRYDAAGVAVGPETKVNTTTAMNQYYASVTPTATGYIVSYVSEATATTSRIYLQKYDLNGVPVGGEILVSASETGWKTSTSITSLSDGGYVVVWSSQNQDAAGTWGVYFQRFDAANNKVGGETRVNDTVTGDQQFASVAMLLDGSFTITWQSSVGTGDGNGWGVFQKTYYLDRTIDGNSSPNLLIGGGGNDTIRGFGDNDTLDGGQGPGNDTLYGGDGDDTLNLGGGDTGYGEGGNDTFVIGTLTGESIFLSAGAGYDILDATGVIYDTFWNFGGADGLEEFRGSANNDTFDAHTSTETFIRTIKGFGGNDTLYGSRGNDVLDGGAADDILHGGVGADSLTGGAGIDAASYIYSTVGLTVNMSNMAANTGDAAGDSYASIENLIGSNLNDQLRGNGGNNVIYGKNGNDTLDGNVGADTLFGGAGNDTYIIDNLGDVANEDEGNNGNDGGVDLVESQVDFILGNYIENLTLFGAAIAGDGNGLNNTLLGNGLNNLLKGLGGNDTLDGAVGADTMIGGAGDDTYRVQDINDVVTEVAAEGTDTVESSITYALKVNFENLTLMGAAAIDGTGNAANNTIIGNGNDNVLKGNGGTDTFKGMGGNDTYYVDDPTDTVSEESAPGVDAGGLDRVYSQITYTLGNFVEELALQGTADINGFGNGLNNRIFGNSGNNSLNGLAGADTMSGGNGNDIYYVDNSGDIIQETSTGGNDTVFTSATLTMRNYIETLIMTGSANINTIGNNQDSSIFGNSGNNTIDGRAGIDIMKGGAGNDIYVVDNVGDVVSEETVVGIDDGGDDRINASVSFTLPNFVERLSLTGALSINGTGNALNNTIIGNTGNNKITGGAGNDTLRGDAGNDTYIFGPNFGVDTINDTAGAVDRITFAAGIVAADVIMEDVGADRYYGVRDLANPALTASQVANRIRIIGGAGGAVIESITYSTTPAPAADALGQAMLAWTDEQAVEFSPNQTVMDKAKIEFAANSNFQNNLL